MAFNIPTLAEAVRQVENGFSIAFYGAAGAIRVSVLKVLSKVIGGTNHVIALKCRDIWKNNFVATADAESLATVHAQRWNLPHKPATKAHGLVSVTFSGSGRVPAGTIFVDSTGMEYELIEDVSRSSAGAINGRIICTTAGSAGNATAGVALSFRDGDVANVSGAITWGRILGGALYSVQVGSEMQQWGETLEDYRARLLERQQNQPQGGCGVDYKSWLKRFDFVSDAWVVDNYPNTNSVACFIADFSGSDGYIAASDVAKAQAYVTAENRKPVNADPIVANPTRLSSAVTVFSGVLSDVAKSSVESAVKKLLQKYGPGMTLILSDLEETVKASAGDYTARVSQFSVDGVSQGESYTLPISSSGRTLAGSIFNTYSISFTWVTR